MIKTFVMPRNPPPDDKDNDHLDHCSLDSFSHNINASL